MDDAVHPQSLRSEQAPCCNLCCHPCHLALRGSPTSGHSGPECRRDDVEAGQRMSEQIREIVSVHQSP